MFVAELVQRFIGFMCIAMFLVGVALLFVMAVIFMMFAMLVISMAVMRLHGFERH